MIVTRLALFIFGTKHSIELKRPCMVNFAVFKMPKTYFYGIVNVKLPIYQILHL